MKRREEKRNGKADLTAFWMTMINRRNLSDSVKKIVNRLREEKLLEL